MLAKPRIEYGHIVMVQSASFRWVGAGGETASAKRTQRRMQAAGGFAVLLKLIQPRNKGDADGDAFNVAEASTEGARLVCSGGSVGVHKTVACIQGNERELGRPGSFLARGSGPSTNGRGLR